MYGKNKQWDADTGNYAKWAKENEGVGYFLVSTDTFTRYVWTRLLKTLQGKEMEKVLEDLFEEVSTWKDILQTWLYFKNLWWKRG